MNIVFYLLILLFITIAYFFLSFFFAWIGSLASKLFNKYRGVDGETVISTNLRSKIKNEEISKSLTKEMLMKMAIEKWDGSLPKVSSDGISAMINLEN